MDMVDSDIYNAQHGRSGSVTHTNRKQMSKYCVAHSKRTLKNHDASLTKVGLKKYSGYLAPSDHRKMTPMNRVNLNSAYLYSASRQSSDLKVKNLYSEAKSVNKLSPSLRLAQNEYDTPQVVPKTDTNNSLTVLVMKLADTSQLAAVLNTITPNTNCVTVNHDKLAGRVEANQVQTIP